MDEIKVYSDDARTLKSLAHANALFSGGYGDNDPAIGLNVLLYEFDKLKEENETLQATVNQLTDKYNSACVELNDLSDRYGAVMDSIGCDFADMFPDWDEKEYGD